MSSPFRRLHRTKFTLLAVVSVFLGMVLVFVAQWVGTEADATWLRRVPVNEVGLGLFTTGLFGVLFQYVGQRDAEEEHVRRIREVIAEDLAVRPDGLVKLVSAETRDEIIRNCLGVQLGDHPLATDIYDDLREQLIRTAERQYDLDVAIDLAPWTGGQTAGRGTMFVATLRWEYRTTIVKPVMRFACVSDLDEYRDMLRDPSGSVVHYFEPVGTLDGGSEGAFELAQCAVDGKQLPARRTTRSGSQIYTVNLGADVVKDARRVTISYTYRVLVQQHGHLLHVDVPRPTNGLTVRFAYGNCGIRYVNVLDYIASTQQPRVSRLPASGPTPSIQVGFDGWVLPKAGVAFVWVLDGELTSQVASPASQSHPRIPRRQLVEPPLR